MRTVAFVENIEFEYQGNVFSKAISVGDVDNDQNNELILGTIRGDLYIFKGRVKKPWATASDLGTITCLLIGDVCNQGGLNSLVVLTSEGYCYVFIVEYEHIPQDELANQEDRKPILLKPAHKQHILANNKALVIADINGDGLNELVIGYSDRQVRMYRWVNTGDDLPSSVSTLSGQFCLMYTWHLAGQLSSLTVNQRDDGEVDLMASQPGGTFVTLYYKKDNTEANQERSQDNRRDGSVGCTLLFHPLGSARARNAGVTTEVVASISWQKQEIKTGVANYSAICTLDGTLTLVDNDRILWSIYVDHQLFSLTKLDVTGDGSEEVVACSWDGHTYLVNLNKEVVRFKFRENVAAFCAGHYAIEKDVNVPCLFYVTFNNRVVVYYKINMPNIANMTLTETMEQQERLQPLLQSFNCDASNPNQISQLYNWCLYGFHPKTT